MQGCWCLGLRYVFLEVIRDVVTALLQDNNTLMNTTARLQLICVSGQGCFAFCACLHGVVGTCRVTALKPDFSGLQIHSFTCVLFWKVTYRQGSLDKGLHTQEASLGRLKGRVAVMESRPAAVVTPVSYL